MHLVGGLPIEIEPEEALIPDERKALARISRQGVGPGERALPFRLRLVAEPPWASADPALFADGGPAAIDWVDERVRVSHARFVAELDPVDRSGRLFRRSRWVGALEVTLRTVLCSRLPFEGGLPLHAAGIVPDGRGIAFFGVSGAGKSTLAGLSPHPVLSDELVAVVADHSGTGPAPFALTASGFWGTGEQDRTSEQPWPLVALVELAKGARGDREARSRDHGTAGPAPLVGRSGRPGPSGAGGPGLPHGLVARAGSLVRSPGGTV